MSQKRKTTSTRQKPQEKNKMQPATSKPETSDLWINPDLNRKIAGPGGNRGDHTTSTAKLLELADIALKKGA
jgi:hypothetical protein